MNSSKRRTLLCLLLAATAVPIVAAQSKNRLKPTPELLPVTGQPVPQLSAYDDAMQNLMAAKGIPTGALAVMRNSVIIFERGYGWKDAAHTIPVPRNAPFRLASVTKSLTQSAIMKLSRDGVLNMNDKAFCVAPFDPTCHLNIAPFSTPDPNLRNVTIQNLFDHKSGITIDVVDQDITVAAAMGIASPPTTTQMTSYWMSRPFAYSPGSTYSYNNSGYVTLGLIVEQVSGRTFDAFLQNVVLPPAGVSASEVQQARSLPAFRNPREPFYYDTVLQTSAFNPTLTVYSVDGGWSLESEPGAGGMIATARALVQYMNIYWLNGGLRNGCNVCGDLTYAGNMPGAYTLARQRTDAINYAALFNKSRDGNAPGYDNNDIKVALDNATALVTSWPTTPVPASWDYLPLVIK